MVLVKVLDFVRVFYLDVESYSTGAQCFSVTIRAFVFGHFHSFSSICWHFVSHAIEQDSSLSLTVILRG